MTPVTKDIDRPLGQDKRPRNTGGGSRVRAGALLLTAGALAVLATSTAIALRERPFRDPPRGVVSAPEARETAEEPSDTAEIEADAEAEADAVAAAQKAASRSGAPAPSITRINPVDRPDGPSTIVVRDPSNLDRGTRLAHLPDRALIEESETGPLPVRGADGSRPFEAYARPWSGARGARVALVVGGLGLSQTGTQEAIAKLPSDITLAFAPQGNSLDRWMREARREGHEILMQVPLEPYDYPRVNPGRNTLTVEAPASETLGQLRWALSRTTNYTGVMNYMGGRFSANEDAMSRVMAELGRRGLGYLDDGTSSQSLAKSLAERNGVPFAAGDTVVDAARERGEILEKLDELERTARAQGAAIGTASAFEVTVDAIASWAAEVRKRGIELVPVSAVANDPEKG